MTPHLQIHYSLPYLKVLFDGYGHEPGDLNFDEVIGKTEKWGNNFTEFLRGYEEKIFEIMPKVTGYDWDEKYHVRIPLYLVYPFPKMPSFSDPLTLKVREDPIQTLGILLHELAHINIEEKMESEELQESLMTLVALRIMFLLQLDTQKVRALFECIYHKRFDKNLELPSLGFRTVKEYLSQLSN